MSRRRGIGAALVAFLAGLGGAWPASSAAQQPGEEALLRNIDELIPQYTEALAARDARLRASEAAERRPTPTDTAQVGPMRIVTIPDELDVARELFDEVWREDFPRVTESASLRGHTFVFQWRTRLRSLEVSPGPDGQLIRVDMSRSWAPTRDHAKAGIRDAIARALVRDFPDGSPMRGWLSFQAYPDTESAYRLLAISTTGATQQCLVGDIDACQAALGFGLTDATDDLPRWFDPQERQEMVRAARANGSADSRVDRDGPLHRGCVEENDVRACDALLAELEWVVWLPVSDRIRAHVLWYAVRAGGEGAWRRALERREAPMPEVLTHVSGLPVDELVADWRADLIGHRPDVHAGLGGKGTRVLLWVLIFAAFAMRSTRWRLG